MSFNQGYTPSSAHLRMWEPFVLGRLAPQADVRSLNHSLQGRCPKLTNPRPNRQEAARFGAAQLRGLMPPRMKAGVARSLPHYPVTDYPGRCITPGVDGVAQIRLHPFHTADEGVGI